MTTQQEIRDVLHRRMQIGRKYRLDELYSIVKKWCFLDDEDCDPQAPGASRPKWERNVRNVLKEAKRPSWILYHGSATYERY